MLQVRKMLVDKAFNSHALPTLLVGWIATNQRVTGNHVERFFEAVVNGILEHEKDSIV